MIENFLLPLFRSLGVGDPYRWQVEAFERLLQGDIPGQIKVPTAAGKTMMLAVFVAALAACASVGDLRLPRRLVHVVNRRILVDEASTLAARLRQVLDQDARLVAHGVALRRLSATGNTLSIATLRGGLEDRGDWSVDPSSAALILATPDMLGSRLLFRGYGLGRSRAATQAGLLGMDTLVIHDEAHLAPAFTRLLRQVEARAAHGTEALGRPGLHVIEMTATLTGGAPHRPLLCAVAEDAALTRRMSAPKRLAVHRVPDGAGKPVTAVVDAMARAALVHRDANRAVAVFVSTPASADAVAGRLMKQGITADRIVVLTGTMRGHEREALGEMPAFLRFHNGERRGSDGSAWFIATSAGEIGLDIDADVGLFDLGTIDRFVQRAGRVNRRGLGQGVIKLHHAGGAEVPEALRERAVASLRLLRTLAPAGEEQDASPMALSALADDPLWSEACAPAPPVRTLEPAVLRMLSMTSLRLDELGCPAPEVYIHGIVDDEPQVNLAWRRLPAPGADLAEWLDRWPVVPAECARLPIDSARRLLSQRFDEALPALTPVAIALDPQGQLAGGDAVLSPGMRWSAWVRRLRPGSTVLLATAVGGLNPQGLPAPDASGAVSDVSALVTAGSGQSRGEVLSFEVRHLVTEEHSQWVSGAREAASLETLLDALCTDRPQASEPADVGGDMELVFHDGPGPAHSGAWQGEVTCWLLPRQLRSADAGDLAALAPVDRPLGEHLDLAARAAARLGERLGLAAPLQEALVRAAAEHDAGKAWERWQQAIGNTDPNRPLGKSAATAFDFRINDGYRHELGSLVDRGHRLGALDAHLVAAHHGWARPSFTQAALDKPGCAAAGRDCAERFAELNEHWGPWALAWIEAVLKAADIQAETQAAELATQTQAPVSTTPAASLRTADPVPPGRFSLAVDQRNFGEVLACLGLATLVAPLQPGLRLGWSEQGFELVGIDEATVITGLQRIAGARADLDRETTAKDLVGAAFPPLLLSLPDGEHIALNHWLDERLRDKSAWKLGAGQMKALDTLDNALRACQRSLSLPDFAPERLFAIGGNRVGAEASKFRFDAATSWSAQDAGFSLNESDAFKSVRPWVELLSAIGLQAWLLPPADRIHDRPRYHLWTRPLPPTLALVALRGLLPESGPGLVPVFTNSGQMNDVFPSQPHHASRTPSCQTLVTLI